ncbi:filamentous hemagglutinin family N-terminal domain-containing protein, partial [Geoalkalibacter ferrihydriticus]
MNKIFRLIWNDTFGTLVAVAEIVSSRGRGAGKRCRLRLPAMALLLSLWICVGTAAAGTLPTGGNIVAGSGAINSSGNTLTVTQDTQRMAADWTSFSIGQNNTVNFNQPSSSAVALNRVTGADASVIQGALNANGQVFLVNPNGVLFSSGAQVNVGGFVASTLDISNDDFMAGNYRFAGTSSNAIVNQGNITAHNGGSIALIAARIENSGTLTANGGNVLMGAGSKVTLDLGGPVKIEVEEAAIDALIEQGGAIRADGGLVYLTARAAGELTSTVINHTGITEAQSLATGENGEIYLMGDMEHGRIEVAGTLDASAPHGGDGGFVETSAAVVDIKPDLQVTTYAPEGKTGEWLIDPTNIEIVAGDGGSFIENVSTSSSIGADTLVSNLTNNNITVQTPAAGDDPGNITVSADLVWDTNTQLTLDAHNNINVNATIENTNATGGGVYFDAVNNRTAVQFNENGKVVIHNIEQLQWMNTALNGTYELGADIDALATSNWNPDGESYLGFTPIGTFAAHFTGTFDGLGHEITDLTINRPGTDYVGLLGWVNSGGTVKNIGLTDVFISGRHYVGGLIGYATQGSVTNSYVTGSVKGGGNQVGGLIGQFSGSSVTNSYATGSVEGKNFVGGLIGYNEGTIDTNYSTAVVQGSYATGGLVGYAKPGSITNSYATGLVEGGYATGGLIGYNEGTVANNFANGAVLGEEATGGLIGENSGGSIFYSFWDMHTSGINTSAGGTGKTTTEMHMPSTFSDWNEDDSLWTLTAGGESEAGYEVVLPYLTNVTREEDRMMSTLFAGGWGNGENPYTITDWNQLQNINAVAGEDFSFKLLNILNASTAGYDLQVNGGEALANDGKGWAPIGSWSNSVPYAGTFDGNDKKISGLIIDRPGEYDIGLFGTVVDTTISNLTLSDVDILGGYSVGSVVGLAGNNTHLENINVTDGAVAGTYDVGGLVGVMTESLRTIVDSHANVSVSGNAVVGGLVGSLYGSSIINSSASGSVNGLSREVGGLVGEARSGAQIIGSHATGDVASGAGEEADSRNFGGLVGLADDNVHIENSYATGNVVGGRYVGGLVGWMGASLKTIQRSYATGDVMGTEGVGGLVGFLDSSTISE